MYSFLSVQAEADSSLVREATFQGRQYLVVPVVAIVEGVLQGANSEVPELALANQFGRHLGGWNGRPVVMNHPQDAEGDFVSANAPDVLDNWAFGSMFDAVVKDNKLIVDAWLDVEKANELGGDFQSTVERIQNGTMVEVSVGVFVNLIEKKGKYGGKNYQAIWTEVVPDHLALLSEGITGACSNEAGCGTPRVNVLRANVNPGVMDMSIRAGQQPSKKEVKADNNETSGEVKTTSAKATSPTEGHDSSLQDMSCGCNASGGTCSCSNSAPAVLNDLQVAKALARMSRLSVNGIPAERFSKDIYSAIRTAVYKKFPYSYCYGYTADFVVFEGYDEKTETFAYYKVGIDVDANLNVTFTSDPVEVVLATTVIDVGQEEITAMEKNAGGNADTTTTTTTTATAETPAPAAPTVNAASAPVQLTVEQFISAAPAEIQAVLQEGMRVQTERRTAVVKALQETGRCQFTEDQLSAMTLENLEKLQTLASVPTFQGQGVPRVIVNNASREEAPTPPRVFADDRAGSTSKAS